MPREPQSGVAYSYIRFSSREQDKGDSLRRQTHLRDEWLKRNPAVTLDTSLTLADLGVSGFRGKHRGDKHALGLFLKMVDAGRIRPGSMLIIENLDRLTREDELEATHLFTGLLLKGVRVVQLEPETVFDRQSGQLEIMRAVLELGRGHEESLRKSFRVAAAWSKKKERAAASRVVVTAKCPAWLEVSDGAFRFRPGAKAALRRIVRMSLAGHGARVIAKSLNTGGVPPLGGRAWEEAYVRKLLRGRAIAGEYQPMAGRRNERKPDGGPVPGYFPAVVNEDEWRRLQAVIGGRRNRGGRPGKGFVNVFAALLRGYGGSVYPVGRIDRGTAYRVLMPAASRRHGRAGASFPLDTFERAVLRCLREIDPKDVLPPDDGETARAVVDLAARRSEIESQLARIESQLVANGNVEVLTRAAASLQAERAKVDGELSALQSAAALPAAEAWGTAGSLFDVVANSPDQLEARRRLNVALCRIVERINVVFTRRASVALCAVQVRFVNGPVRSYLIEHHPARGDRHGGASTPARYAVAWLLTDGRDEPDLGDPGQADALSAALSVRPPVTPDHQPPTRGRGKPRRPSTKEGRGDGELRAT